MDKIKLDGRLGFSLDVSQEEFNVLTGKDRAAARELLVNLVQSEQCHFVGDTYFPVEWNEDVLTYEMEDELSFDLPEVSPMAKLSRTLDLLNATIDSLIEDQGLRPREAIATLLERGFTPDELIELHFDEKDVLDLVKEYAAKATLTDGEREWDVTIYSHYASYEDALAGIEHFNSHGYNVVKTWVEPTCNDKEVSLEDKLADAQDRAGEAKDAPVGKDTYELE